MRRIGILINTIYSDYSIMFLNGVEKYCRENDCSCYIFPLAHGSNTGIYEYHYEVLLQFISKNNIDGLLIASSTLSYDSSITEISRQIKSFDPSLPKISVGVEVENVHSMLIDSVTALKELCEHLIEEHGIKNPVVVRCSEGNFESDERERTVLQTFSSHGIDIPKERILDGLFLLDNAHTVFENFVKQNGVDFDAVICLNDTMAMGVYQCLVERGIRIPQDVIVTGFDNAVASSRDELNLTTVDQRIKDLAYNATGDLIALMNGAEVLKRKSIYAVPIFRASCGCQEAVCSENDKNNSMLMQHRHEILQASGMQIYMLHYFLMEIQTPVPLDNLYPRLHYSLNVFDINGFVMVLYDTPVFYAKDSDFHRPSSARVAMTLFGDEYFERPDIVFNSDLNMLPTDIVNKMSGSYTVFPLFAEGFHYGYLFFNFGGYERIFYQTVFELIAKEIITSIEISYEQSQNNSLKDQNISLEQYSQKMHLMSFTDDMTGLLNRRGFYEYARQKISSSQNAKRKGLVIYCDMDGLKKINDTYGHNAGDRAIKYEAKVLRKVFSPMDILARLGGDEFAVIVSGIGAKDFPRIKKEIDEECDKINSETLDPFELSMSCGFAEFDTASNDIDELLSRADSSQYEDKRSKKEHTKSNVRRSFFRSRRTD